MFKWLHEYDLAYWQMRSALGYGIPARIERRWPRGMNAGNPYACGICGARRRHPGLHVSHDIEHYRKSLFGHEREDFEHRVAAALGRSGGPPAERAA